jgi:hypothetical protein
VGGSAKLPVLSGLVFVNSGTPERKRGVMWPDQARPHPEQNVPTITMTPQLTENCSYGMQPPATWKYPLLFVAAICIEPEA